MADFYKPISHTADLGIRLTCKTLPELYINSARALTDLIAGIENIHSLIRQEIIVEAIDYNDLLIRFLNELVYLFAVKKALFSKFEIIDLSQNLLRIKAYGELFDRRKHCIKKEIKAATYHNVNIEKVGTQFRVTIIFDV